MSEHGYLLADNPRNRAFERAIQAQIEPGQVVCDLGCGTGILGFMALRAGAGRVIGIEQDRVIDEARQLAAANMWSERTVYLQGRSDELSPPEPADWIVVEWLSSLGADEWPPWILADALQRYLKPGGRIIPAAVQHYLVPVCAPETWTAALGHASGTRYGVDWRPLLDSASKRLYAFDIPAESALDTPRCWLDVSLSDAERLRSLNPFEGGPLAFTVQRDGDCHGLAGWFAADLGSGITLTNAPEAAPTHWRQTFLPLAEPLNVKKGDTLTARVAKRWVGNNSHHSWQVEQRRNETVIACGGSGETWADALTPAEMARITARFIPEAGPADIRLAALLAQVDGRRSAEDVADRTAQTRPDLFPTPEDALNELIRQWRKRPLKPLKKGSSE